MSISPHPSCITHKTWLLLAVVCACILLPLAFFPMADDQAIYFVGGEMIAVDGAVPYRDFIDTKPPAIFYLNALAITLFGDHGASIRILDALIQGATALLLILLVERMSGDRLWACISGILYAFVYVSLSPAGTAHSESYTGIIAVGMLLMVLYRRTTTSFLIAGVLAGVAFLFKYTLGMVLIIGVIAEISMEESWPGRIRHCLWIGLGFATVILLFGLFLLQSGVWDGFLLQQEFLRGYVGIHFQSKMEWLKEMVKETGEHLGGGYSITLLTLTLVGAGYSLNETADRLFAGTRRQLLLQIFAFGFIAMLVSVWIEAHYLYHFSRINIFGVPLAAYALTRIIRLLSDKKRKRLMVQSILYTGVIVAILFSPAMRYFYHSFAAFLSTIKGVETLDSYYSQNSPRCTRTELMELRQYVHEHGGGVHDVFVGGVVGGFVHYSLGSIPQYQLYQSVLFTATYAPEAWKQQTIQYLVEHQPHFIIAQTQDGDPMLVGEAMPTFKWLMSQPAVNSLISSRYRAARTTLNFVLYERIGGIQ